MSGTIANPIGITNPPIDDLLEVADSKYALVIYSAQRARQINAYYSQLQEGLLDYVGPLVESEVHEKPLSVALREINEGLVTSTPIVEGETPAADEVDIDVDMVELADAAALDAGVPTDEGVTPDEV